MVNIVYKNSKWVASLFWLLMLLIYSTPGFSAASTKEKNQKTSESSKEIPPELKSYTFQNIEPGQLKTTLKKIEGFQVWLSDYVDGFGQEIDNLFGTDRQFDPPVAEWRYAWA